MDSREVDYAAVFMVICGLFPTVKNRLQLDPLTDMEVQISTFQVHKAARVPDSDQTNWMVRTWERNMRLQKLCLSFDCARLD